MRSLFGIVLLAFAMGVVGFQPVSAGEARLIEEQGSSWAPGQFLPNANPSAFDQVFDSLLPAATAKAVGYMMNCDIFLSDCQDKVQVVLASIGAPTAVDLYDPYSIALAYQDAGLDVTFAGKSEYDTKLVMVATQPTVAIEALASPVSDVCELSPTSMCADMDEDFSPEQASVLSLDIAVILASL